MSLVVQLWDDNIPKILMVPDRNSKTSVLQDLSVNERSTAERQICLVIVSLQNIRGCSIALLLEVVSRNFHKVHNSELSVQLHWRSDFLFFFQNKDVTICVERAPVFWFSTNKAVKVDQDLPIRNSTNSVFLTTTFCHLQAENIAKYDTNWEDEYYKG